MAIATAKIRMYAGTNSTGTSNLLPSPDVLQTTEEVIWSANAGRSISATDGALMMGDVVAQKKTFNITWGVLTQAEYNSIVSLLGTGFRPFTLVLGTQVISITSYRGTITAELLGAPGGSIFYRNASVSIIQR